jgi:putative membrane protein
MVIILNILFLAGAILLIGRIMPSVHIKNFMTAIIVAVTYSFFSWLLGGLLTLLTLPLTILTFGLFKFVINGFLLWLTDQLIEDFRIEGFLSTIIAVILISIVDGILHWLLLV